MWNDHESRVFQTAIERVIVTTAGGQAALDVQQKGISGKVLKPLIQIGVGAYHREKLGWDPEQVVPFKTQLKIFHKYRVERVVHTGGDLDGLPTPMEEEYLRRVRAGQVYGGNAVSFLTSF